MASFFQYMAQWGIWDIIGLLLTLFPLVLIWVYVFPRMAIDSLYIDTRITSRDGDLFPVVITVEIRNHTNDPIYLRSHGFTFGQTIKPSPIATKNAATAVYEIKFMGRVENMLTEIDILVRPNQIVTTFIPVDPNQDEQVLTDALASRSVGELNLQVQRISTRPHPFTKLKIPV